MKIPLRELRQQILDCVRFNRQQFEVMDDGERVTVSLGSQDSGVERDPYEVIFFERSSKLYVWPGAVGIRNRANPDAVVRPFVPKLKGTPLDADTKPFFDSSDITAGVNYEVVVIYDEAHARVELRDTEEDLVLLNCETAWQVATVTFATEGSGFRVSAFKQTWQSDITSFIDESSCESNQSSDESGSDDSSDTPDSSDDSSDSSGDSSSSSGGCACPAITNLAVILLEVDGSEDFLCFDALATLTPIKVRIVCDVGEICADCRNKLDVRLSIAGHSGRYFLGSGPAPGAYAEITFNAFGCTDYTVTAQIIRAGISVSGDHCSVSCDPVSITWTTPGRCDEGGSCT